MTPVSARTLRRWVRTLTVGLVLAVFALATLGAFYQALSTLIDARRYDPPGRLVSMGAFDMHLYCTGAGSPTVVLEAGATGFAQSWAWIQDDLAATTRTCSYDRAGMGWSEGARTDHDGVAIATNLETLLDRAGETGPYVLIGHSMGGTFVRIFADRYPEEVVGLALLDPAHEDQLDRLPEETVEQYHSFARSFRIAARIARIGVLRATNLIGRNAEGLPETDFATARMFAASPKHLRTSYAELAAWYETMDAARDHRSFHNGPLLVVSAARLMEDMSPEMLSVNLEMHAELADLSPRGRHLIMEEADHFSLLMDRATAARVTGHLRELLEEIRSISAPL